MVSKKIEAYSVDDLLKDAKAGAEQALLEEELNQIKEHQLHLESVAEKEWNEKQSNDFLRELEEL